MKTLKRIVLALVVLVVLVVVVGFFLPSTAHVERTTVIDAPQSTLYALLSGFGRFNEWSPWADADPTPTPSTPLKARPTASAPR